MAQNHWNHKDRLLRAVVDFYDAELAKARSLGVGLDTPSSSPPDTTRTVACPHNRERSSSSEGPELPRKQSATFSGAETSLPIAQKRKRIGMEDMQATFSIMPGGGKTRTKRPMTDAEREQYRLTKKVGACDPCRKRKRKCVCKLQSEAQAPAIKRARLDDDILPKEHDPVISKSSAPTIDAERDALTQVFQLPASDVTKLHTGSDHIIGEAPEDLSVARCSPSLSLSPLIRAFDAQFDPCDFSQCPELSLGDLAMPGTPILSLDLQAEHIPVDSIPTTDTAVMSDGFDMLPNDYLDCEAFVNFPVLETAMSTFKTNLPAQDGLAWHPDACSLGQLNSTLNIVHKLISRATKALAPITPFVTETQCLLAELRTLDLQVNLLRKSLPFWSQSSQSQSTVSDLAQNMREPLLAFLRRIEMVDPMGLKLRPTFFRDESLVKDDVRRMRGLIAGWISSIGCIMTLISMEALRETQMLLHPTQTLGLDFAAVLEAGSGVGHFG
ncbi:hypothetical protein FKW77_005150 [Venturia effusa]|uniref:Uncharacterized protein n=1 Tax=Venturia effusa TaxID=50376 RepID=A0A517LQ48_9PEZI|nr:hypothetical protein FKW77_005150 [Venturia effusa]